MNFAKFSFSFLMAAFILSACNTIEGAGEDIRAGGNAIDNAAEKNKSY